MEKKRYIVLYWCPVVIYCTLIFLQSSFPAPDKIPDLPHIDKVLHFSAYALLGALFFRAYRRPSITKNITFLILLSIFSSTLYGITDEIHQYFILERSADPLDALTDFIGSIIGVISYRALVEKYFSSYPYHSRIDKIADFI